MRAAILAVSVLPTALFALTLDIPGNPERVAEEIEPLGSYAVPVAPWVDGHLPVRVTEGEVTRQAWRIRGEGIATLQIVGPLRQQLVADGFSVLLDCEAQICGGFDFRFATEVMAPPAMYVDLSSFRFLAAERQDAAGQAERVGILVSRSATQAYVQIIRVGAPVEGAGIASADAAPLMPTTPLAPVMLPNDLGFALETEGRVVLSDLAFPTGTAQLGEGAFASLAALAEYLRANPGRRVALVGHTDAEGALEVNITISKRRAASVVERLASAHGIARQQMVAEGMGWLAPIATNLTSEGRERNRRVEVVLISTE